MRMPVHVCIFQTCFYVHVYVYMYVYTYQFEIRNVRCCMLQRVAESCLVLINGNTNYVLQCVAVCCSVLQCVAVCCGVLQYVAVCCSELYCANQWN